MRRAVIVATLLCALGAAPAIAALPVGARAPQIATMGALAGKPFRFDLGQALRKGPVVLYFYPKAFTHGCTLEARAFSEKIGEFRKAGAQVVGLSGDNLDTLKKFSVEECRNAFPVAIASRQTIKAYDVAFALKPSLSNRTSYVIAPSGNVVMVHSDLDWSEHVSKTLSAVKSLKK